MLSVRSLSKTTQRPVVSVALALSLLMGGLLASATAWASPLGQTQSNMEHLKMLSGKDFEIDFMSEMIQHHTSALDMAKLVPDRANHQELKDAAQKIIDSQTQEISQMTGWLQQWYNIAPKQGMMQPMAGMGMSDMMDLQSLKGDTFDEKFLTMMRMHHMGAVEMAQLVPSRATHTELKTLAQNIISSQSAEIQQFDGWLKTWYNVDASSMGGSMGAMSGGGTMPSGSMGGNSGSMPQTGRDDGIQESLLSLALVALATIGAGGMLLLGGVWLRKRA